jgi:hypothetical protein
LLDDDGEIISRAAALASFGNDRQDDDANRTLVRGSDY